MKAIQVLPMLLLILLGSGCSKDNGGTSPDSGPHTVKYMVTATQADVLSIAYTNEGGGTTTVSPTASSWEWENTFMGGATVAVVAGGVSMSGARVVIHATIMKDGAVFKDAQAENNSNCSVSIAGQI